MGCWKPHTIGTLKLNVDGVIFASIRATEIRTILLDNKGDIILVASIREQADFDPTSIECLAIYKGLQLCLNMGITNLLVESDCQVIVQVIKQPERPFAMLENIVRHSNVDELLLELQDLI